MFNYLDKYTKYKNKYLKLKKIQEGGVVSCNIGYKNVLGTCWAISEQMIFTFGDATSNNLEKVMKSFKIDCQYINTIESRKCFIERQIQKVKSNDELNEFFLPVNIFSDEKISYLKEILDKFIVRYYSKILYIKNLKKPEDINDKENTERCELIISNNFKKLFNYPILKKNEKVHGGNLIEEFLFMNLLSIFLLDHKVSFKKYNNNFNEINFNIDEDLGILIKIDSHMCSLFSCNNSLIYYNDRKIKNFDWKTLLKNANTNNLYIQKEDPPLLLIDDINTYMGNKETLSKVIYLLVVSKYKQESSLDSNIKNILNNNFNSSQISDSELQLEIANMIEDSEGDKNCKAKRAMLWYRLAAEQGNVSAQYILGKIFFHGEIVVQDYVEAMKWYRLAAEQGDIDAQMNMGNMFDDGIGVAKVDKEEAMRWYQLAANQGDEEAQKILKKSKRYKKIQIF